MVVRLIRFICIVFFDFVVFVFVVVIVSINVLINEKKIGIKKYEEKNI